jgi:RNA recognition motif-containing protein
MNIMVRNLNLLTTAEQLSNLFVRFGLVKSAKIVRSDVSGHSMGIGYIKMDRHSGNSAINGLNDLRFMNFYIDVSEAVM